MAEWQAATSRFDSSGSDPQHPRTVAVTLPLSLFRGGKWLFACDAFALLDGHDLIRGDSCNTLGLSIRPADGNVSRYRLAQSEVQPEITLRDKGTAAADFFHL